MSERKDKGVELKIGEADKEGQLVQVIYAHQTGRYTVYATAERLKVWFADDPRLQLLFRRRLVAISNLRSRISGLQSVLNTPTRAQRFWHWLRREDIPVDSGPLVHWRDPTAFAIVDALEGNAEAANETLAYVHSQLFAVRLARARHTYLRWGIVTVCTVMLLAGMANTMAVDSVYCAPILHNLTLAVSIGALGAFFSIAQSISSRRIRADGQGQVDVITRILVGCMSAFVLEALLDSGLVSLTIGTQSLVAQVQLCPPTNLTSWPVTIVAAFLAGFAEKLIPDLMKRYADQASGDDRDESPLAYGARRGAASGPATARAVTGNGPALGTGPMPDDPKGIDTPPPVPPDPTAAATEAATAETEAATAEEAAASQGLSDTPADSLSAEADSIDADGVDANDSAAADSDTGRAGSGGTG